MTMEMSTSDSNRQQWLGSPEPIERAHILVVDDNPHIRLAFRTVLEKAGYSVSVAEDGVHALLKLGLGGERPSLILLDVLMPGLDGIELMEALNAFQIPYRPELVVLTAHRSEASAARAAQLGARAVLSKPLLPDQLLAVVRKCLASRRPAAAFQPRQSAS